MYFFACVCNTSNSIKEQTLDICKIKLTSDSDRTESRDAIASEKKVFLFLPLSSANQYHACQGVVCKKKIYLTEARVG